MLRPLAAFLAGAGLLAALALPVRAGSDEPIRQNMAGLRLGDTLEDVQSIYPPATDWPSVVDPRGHVKRYKVERGMAKAFPTWTSIMNLGFKRGKLVEIQLIYDAARTRAMPHEELASEYSLRYGEPQREDARFWWSDGSVVLRVFPAEIPAVHDGVQAVEWRTSEQLVQEGLYKRVD
jgi:hypothetical protein